jgi:hypothetical protein
MSANTNTTTDGRPGPRPARFPLGSTYITPGARDALAEAGQGARAFLARHVTGDWGDVACDDKRENEFSLDKHLRIFSAYHTTEGVKVWIITEADRSATTIHLPGEY